MATTASAIAPGRKPQHFMQLDGVRAFAALAVIVFHEGRFVSMPFFGNLGNNGVALFFVLSGFLITGILVRVRDGAERLNSGVGGVLRAFYARRFLRIFPLYYLVLFLLLVLGVRDIRDTIPWHALYLSNILSARAGQYAFPSHFWTLSVEEQFYLAWAPIVLFLPRRWLKGAVIMMIAIGPLSRIGVYLITARKVAAVALPTSCLDLLGIGCLLALLWHDGSNSDALRLRLGRIALAVGTLLLVLETALELADRGMKLRVMLFTLPVALISFWIVDRSTRGFAGLPGRLLGSAPLVYLGTISYGLYVYHIFVPLAARALGLPFPEERGVWRVLAVFVVTVAVASLSWHLYEKPINMLKRRFPYVRKAPTALQPLGVGDLAEG
jgi:peptidoglycan/LPS O-acetylase OafA/YrhL